MRSLSRAALATGFNALNRSTYGAQADKILSGDHNADLLVKAATSPTTLSGTPGLQAIALALVAALVPQSAAAAVIARSLQLRWDQAAQVKVPGIALPHAAFIGEGGMIPVANGTSTIDAVLDPYKLAVLVELTGEIMRSSNAETMVRAAMLANVGPSLDAALFNTNAAVPGISPAGILHGVSPLTATAGGTLSAMVTDIAALADALKSVAGNGGVVLVTSIKQFVALEMLPPGDVPFPMLVSSTLAAGTVIAVATQALCSIVGAPAIEASPHALIQEQDAPTAGVMTGAPVRNVFQTDSISLRFKLPVSWAMRGPGIAYISATSW